MRFPDLPKVEREDKICDMQNGRVGHGSHGHAMIWQKMEKTWKWRRQQIDKGLIEVTVTGTESDEGSDAGEDALLIPETSDSFNDYWVLTGWGE